MQSTAGNIDEYILSLPEERRPVILKLYQTIRENLPEGFAEGMGYGMIGWVVPHSLFPAGYHCDPKLGVPFINLASQKNHISIYHMGLYGSSPLLDWFTGEWQKYSPKKPDIGKACIRFKKEGDIPYELIGELCKKMNPAQWLDVYQQSLESSKKRVK
jgi:uncharacterized protein YdhG (YjbR/CyaY superfamily)